jgi:hypothetical protein
MSKPSGFARIPRSEFLYPECQSCYFHNVEPAICENCDNGSEYEPDEDLEDKLSERKAAIVRFFRKIQTPLPAELIPEELEPAIEEQELQAA